MNRYDNSLTDYLNNLPLPKEIIPEIANCFLVKIYHKKDYFSRMGELNDKLGFVVKGLFYMYIEKIDGSVHTKEFIRTNEFLLATFDPQKDSIVHIRAITDSVILEAKYSAIQKLFAKFREFEVLSKQGMERRVERIYEKLDSLATINAKDRYIFFKQEYGLIENEIPQHIIASYLGITPTQLSRIKKELLLP